MCVNNCLNLILRDHSQWFTVFVAKTLMQSHRMVDKDRVYSYYGTLAMFDNQLACVSVYMHPHEFYRVSSQSVNTTNIFDRDRDSQSCSKYLCTDSGSIM